MSEMLDRYRDLLNLGKNAKFLKIIHDDAMVADVYKIEISAKQVLILKIFERYNDYTNERYCLSHLKKQIQTPDTKKLLF